MDSSRLRTGEMVAGIGGVALFVFLFFDWFSGGGAFDEGGGISGWDGLGGDFSGFIVALTSVAGVTLAVLAMAGKRVNIPVPRGGVTATLGTLSVLIVLWRFFANPGDLKIGIFLGLAAAIAIAAGAILALREDGVEPLVALAGARARTASATAPPATPPPAPTTPVEARTASSGGSTAAKRSTTKGSTTKRSTTRKSSSRSGGKSGSRSGAKRSSSSRSTASRSRSSGSRASSTRSRSSSSKSGSTRSRSSGSRASSTRSRSTSSKGRSSSRSSSRSGGSKRSSGRKKK